MLSGGDGGVCSADDGAEDGCAEGAGLRGAGDLDGAVGDVGVDLHDEGVFGSDAAAGDDVVDRDAVALDLVDDGECAEGGRFDEGAVEVSGRGGECFADDESGEEGIDEDRAVAVVPVEGEEA